MKIRKTALAAFAAAALFALSGCGEEKSAPSAQTNGSVTVGLVQLVEHPALDEANRGIVDALKDRKLNVQIDQQNAQADQSNLGNIAQRFVSQKYPLIFAIATPAAQIVANATDKTPIVATAVTDFEVAKLVKSNQKPDTNVTGSSDLNPVAEQVRLMLEIIPSAKRIGTIYNSSEINSQFQAQILKNELQKRNLELVEFTVSSVNDVQQTAQSMIGKVDVIYVPTDNIIASAMPILTKITSAAKIGVIVGEEGLLKGGGLATVGVNYYNLGRIAGEMGADILEGKSQPQTMPIRYQTEFKSKININVAEQLGITIPTSVSQNAELVRY
ncbi:ABC transporter substrate-binding protein [Parasutterella secunda]|uniref:ABC transporter substrate-binding protein n=1 Tax=Parasutterella secunda TaxID=626947 RepID=A0ABS2GQF4_9BURK|nr:ABC transporter substrate-binding protein [Parasutterella secunda]MBM6928000.1 ABC transporter substrate-binding protein [Parasutterella secunda]